MNMEQFCWWLHGWTELQDTPPTPEQWKMIREHLDLCFNKVTRPLEVKQYSPSLVPAALLKQDCGLMGYVGDGPNPAIDWTKVSQKSC
jgi:hypothetical protein